MDLPVNIFESPIPPKEEPMTPPMSPMLFAPALNWDESTRSWNENWNKERDSLSPLASEMREGLSLQEGTVYRRPFKETTFSQRILQQYSDDVKSGRFEPSTEPPTEPSMAIRDENHCTYLLNLDSPNGPTTAKYTDVYQFHDDLDEKITREEGNTPRYNIDLSDIPDDREAPIDDVYRVYRGLTPPPEEAVSNENPVFPAIEVLSHKMTHPVYIYNFPDGSGRCLEYNHKAPPSSLRPYPLYTCIGCYSYKKSLSNKGRQINFSIVAIGVTNGNFVTDPVKTPHICQPRQTGERLMARKVVELTAQLRVSDDRRTPASLKHEVLESVHNDGNFKALSEEQQAQAVVSLTHGKKANSCNNFSKRVQNNRKRKRERKQGVPGSLDPSMFTAFSNPTSYLVVDAPDLVCQSSKELLLLALESGSLMCFHADGRYKQRPPPFLQKSSQVYSVHAKFRNGCCIPILQAYCMDSTGTTYTKIFSILRDFAVAGGLLDILTTVPVVMDFERASMSAWRKTIGSQVNGCFFHYTQAVKNHWKETGLEKAAKEHPPLRKYFQRVLRAPFCPKSVLLTTEALSPPRYPEVPEDLNPQLDSFCKYYGHTWLSAQALFPELWNSATLPEALTNNSAEGFHTKMRNFFNFARRPSLADYARFFSTELAAATKILPAIKNGLLLPSAADVNKSEKVHQLRKAITDFREVSVTQTVLLSEALAFLDYVGTLF